MAVRQCLWLAAAAVLASFAKPAAASQLTPLTVQQLSGRADLVARGQILSKVCQRDAEGRIHTRLELEISEVWKGDHSLARITMVQAGGCLGEELVVAPGQAEYQVGEEVVVFLVLNSKGEGVTIGLAQGKFELWRDADTGEKLVRNLFHGGPPPLVHQSQGAATAQRVPRNWRLKVSDLKQMVGEESQ